MAKQKRKASPESTPIMRHPLFPAVAALWFAALFGLGSLAIRPGLIETFVLKSHIDTMVPAAAPPLGVTARICIALAMAVFGGLLGARLVMWATKPKPVPHERKRGAGSIGETGLRRRDAHPDAPARMPISAHEEFGEDGLDADAGPAPIPGRRRALTSEEQDAVFTVPEFAPLPGGQPQVIDLGELDLAGSEVEVFDAPNRFDAVPPRQEFVPSIEPAALGQPFGEPTIAPAPQSLPDTAIHAAPQPVANYGAPVAPPIDFSRPHEVVEAANAARTEEAPLFQRCSPVTQMADEAPLAFAPADVPPIAPQSITPEAVAEAAAVALDSLGLVELTERFAATLRKRRAELAASAAAVEIPITVEPVTVEPVPVASPAAAEAEPTDYAVPAFEVPSFSVHEIVPAVEAEPVSAQASIPMQFVPLGATPPVPAMAEAPVPVFAPLGAGAIAPADPASPPPQTLPVALRPISFDDHEEDEDFATYLPMRHIAMPAAQPVAEAPAEIALAPELAPAPSVAPPAAFAPPVEEAEAPEEFADDGYSSLLSMTKPAAPATQPLVRIDEPEPEQAEIEPVVIFPGQAARQGFGEPAPFTQPAVFAPPQTPQVEIASEAPGPEEPAQLRRFDAPGSALAGQVVAAQAPAPVQDPAETERALRAALATLQRMSGAA